MSATKLGGVLAVAAAIGLAACERAPVVAGQVSAQSGAAGTVGDAGGSGTPGSRAGVGGGGEAGVTGVAGWGVPIAGNGEPDCRPAIWYRSADYVRDVDCKVPFERQDEIGWLLAVLPISFPLSCGREWWMTPANHGMTYWAICPDWCEYIHDRLADEEQRLDDCIGIGRGP